MAQEEKKKKGKTKYFFGPHTKPQSNVLKVFHYMAGLRMNDRGSVAALAPWG
jgi:hypothetical protein